MDKISDVNKSIIKDKLGEMVLGTLEEALNALPD